MTDNREYINNRLYINGQPTNEYLCDECKCHVSSLREWNDKQVCSECEEELDQTEIN